MGEVASGEESEVKVIPLTSGKVAFVSNHRFEELSRFMWFAHQNGGIWYAVRNLPGPGQKRIRMHQQILGFNGGDHRDGNGLNCCDYNIRAASQRQNSENQRKRAGSSRYKGVSWHRCGGKWRAYIVVNYHQINLGLFGDEEGAARAYDAAAIEYFGEFARLNFPVERLFDCDDEREVALYLSTEQPNGSREHYHANGEKHPNHKLTWDDVDWMRVYCFQLGWSVRLLTECHNVSRSTVRRVLSEIGWHSAKR
jgi:hypothetical protein